MIGLMELIQSVVWLVDRVRILDQTLLPQQEVYLDMTDFREVAAAIKELKVRGAPAIGVAAAYGVALGALQIKTNSRTVFLRRLNEVSEIIAATRPTARNLFRALERMAKVAASKGSVSHLQEALVAEAIQIHREEIAATRAICRHGAKLLQDGDIVLTHCNTGPLATCGYGTALGVIIEAHRQGKKVKLLADETRPLLQGARLTVWEAQKAGVPMTLITDNMAGYFLKKGEVNCVITGADRIAANGDTANKIGTYTLAVLAKENKVPFYVAAPTSTIDTAIASGEEIVIEERGGDEVTSFQGVRAAPEGTMVANPAFDVTPNRYITAIITENGIIRKPFQKGIKRALA
jgi:methylthioribose-1-phosphate isomerase